MTPRDIACNELVELVTEYLEGALSPSEVAAIEAHLAICEGCQRYLDQTRATLAALGSVPVETLSDDQHTARRVPRTRGVTRRR